VAEALRAGGQHDLQRLWEATVAFTDPEELRLLESEVALFLQWIAEPIGGERLFELLPALGNYTRLDEAVYGLYRLLPPGLEATWLAHLQKRTGIAAPPDFPLETGAAPRSLPEPLEAPASPGPPSVPPGDQIAFICDSRVWVGDADGSNVVPLTTYGESFSGLHWSPNGRWLLTNWLPDFGPDRASGSSEQQALYLLAADGSGGRLLTDDPAVPAWAIRWSPDGRQVVYYAWRRGVDREPEIWALDVETDEMTQLPGVPLWAPDGRHMMYVTDPPENQASTLWLAGGNWEHPQRIAQQVGVWPGAAWTPDSSRVAVALYDMELDEDAVFVYDLQSEQLSSLINGMDLWTIVLSLQVDVQGDVADLTALGTEAPQSLWTAGWSADGRQLALWALWRRDDPATPARAALMLLPADGSSPRVLAYYKRTAISNVAWSPTDPARLTFGWLNQEYLFESYLFDLEAGPIYTATQDRIAAWSPDGAWVAFTGHDRVTIVDQLGQARYSLGSGVSCSEVAWNPVGDFSGLGARAGVIDFGLEALTQRRENTKTQRQ
jgi:Tol biopolymer transport system component